MAWLTYALGGATLIVGSIGLLCISALVGARTRLR